MLPENNKCIKVRFISESESNRTFPVRVWFGSTEFLKSRFGFGSTELSKSQFDFGSVRFDSFFKMSVRIRIGSTRTEPNRFSSVRFGSFSLSDLYIYFIFTCFKTSI
jgi:hypothetical protein